MAEDRPKTPGACMTPAELNSSTSSGAQGDPPEKSLATLLQELHAGSDTAAMTIVDRYTPHILRAVRASLPQSIRSKVDSTDLVNTLLGALLVKRDIFTGVSEPAQLIALLTKAARDRTTDEYRKYCAKARWIRSEEPINRGGPESGSGDPCQIESDRRSGSREATPSRIVAAREQWSELLRSLSDRDRQIVTLRSQGFLSDQIADRLEGVSSRTVRRVLNEFAQRLLE